ncbi:hypothetical protein ACGFOU_36680 [Streptomyces sp. NPDC048595]|uniref:hypothetical protein n=1 Tax=Streptomyces sp. NPDC048595 TaxID=3365576 RepID=UPI0037169FB8
MPEKLTPGPTGKQFTDDVRYAARAVVKTWYVGAWYGLSPAAEAELRETEQTKPQFEKAGR